MGREKMREEVKNRLEEYLRELGIDVSRKFRCLNPSHADENPSMSYDKIRKKAHCFSCLVDYDTFDVMKIKTGLDGAELFDYGCKHFGLRNEENSNSVLEVKKVDVLERKNYVEKTQRELKDSAGERYLKERGITLEIAGVNGIGYDEKIRSLVLEYRGKNYYITRNIEKKEYRKPVGENEPLYEIGEENEKVVYVTEGQIDALSLLQAGAKRVKKLCRRKIFKRSWDNA